jgi:hypothetical protein
MVSTAHSNETLTFHMPIETLRCRRLTMTRCEADLERAQAEHKTRQLIL